ncbi:MAG: UbiA family prenyltransferase [Pseudomonadota bacterium]
MEGATGSAPGATGKDPGVLAVDLDGTLIRSDMLLETWWSVVSQKPGVAAGALATLARDGRAAFKAVLAEAGAENVDPAALPWNEAVLERVRAHRAAGGKTVLVTASDRRVAEGIATHLGLFDAVHASDGTTNLKGANKAAFLVETYGERGFDYAGDHAVDVAVWAKARGAITVDAGDGLRQAAEGAAERAEHIGAPVRPLKAAIKAMRPHQWLKNVLVFVPVLAAHSLVVGDWLAALMAFVCFSMVASGVYLLNDLLDLASDRAHTRKRNRPLASGALPLLTGSIMAPALLGGGVLLAAITTPGAFLGVLILYGILTTAYSFVLKRQLLLDVLTLAGLYTIRIVAGGAATGIEISPWLLALSTFLFFSLAAIKRQAELVANLAEGKEGASGRAYLTTDLQIVTNMALSAGYVSVLVLALYITSDTVATLYGQPLILWCICPVLLYWISRAVMLTHRGLMDDDPVVFAIKDKVSILCGALMVVIFGAGMVL